MVSYFLLFNDLKLLTL